MYNTLEDLALAFRRIGIETELVPGYSVLPSCVATTLKLDGATLLIVDPANLARVNPDYVDTPTWQVQLFNMDEADLVEVLDIHGSCPPSEVVRRSISWLLDLR